ncbi:MAG TPA: hypothetical protein ENN67_07980, partial [Firmicutes bacterium]|nr:hypothetical protein [Bacillota bacterium]
MVKGGIIFRVDGSKELGLGHISRCLNLAETIADEFRDFNVPIHFITVKNPGSDVLFKNSGFSEFVIYIKESADLKNFGKLINDFSPKVLITDIDLRNCTENYLETFFPGLFHASLHEHNFGLLTGDVVIAPTICPMVPCEKGEIGVTHFNGAEYILLSKEIGEIRKSAQP